MKFCSMPFTQIYVGCDEGNITPCPWMYPDQCQVGYLYKKGEDGDELSDLIHSEKMNELKDSIIDGSFRFCRFEACPIMQRNEFEDLTEDEIERLKAIEYPEFINLAYDFVCNQSCPSCRSEMYKPPKNYKEKMEVIERKIMPYVQKAKKISASGMGDPFASPYMMSVLEKLHPEREDFELVLETNGVMFDEEHWNRIRHLAKNWVTITLTINSFDQHIYNQISRNGNLERLLRNLEFIRSLRANNDISFLQLVMVTQDRNFRDIPEFCRRSLNEYNADRVLLRPIYQWGRFSEEEYWFKDILNPEHPYHQEYAEIIKDPILQDPRVYNFAGESSHECRPYPGAGTENQQRVRELEQCIQEKDCCIDDQQRHIAELESQNQNICYNHENTLSDWEKRICELQRKVNMELRDLEKQLFDIQNSKSFKIGRAATYLPRKFRNK